MTAVTANHIRRLAEALMIGVGALLVAGVGGVWKQLTQSIDIADRDPQYLSERWDVRHWVIWFGARYRLAVSELRRRWGARRR